MTARADPAGRAAPALVLAAGPEAERAWAAFPPGIANASTWRCYTSAARLFLDHLAARGASHLLAVTVADAAAWLEAGAATLSAATIRQRRAALDLLLRTLDGLRGAGPAPDATLRPLRLRGRAAVPTRTLTGEEADRLLASIASADALALRDRAMLSLLIHLGLRVSDLTDLRAADLREGAALVVRRGEAEHALLLPSVAAFALADYLALAPAPGPDAPLFRTLARARHRRPPAPLAQADVYRAVRRRAAAAGLAGRIGGASLRLSAITDHAVA